MPDRKARRTSWKPSTLGIHGDGRAEHAHFAVANMTGGNRLLVGLAWPVIFFIFYRRYKSREMNVVRSNAMGILFLGAATVYSFSIPLRGHLSLVDTGVMFTLFGAYMYLASRFPPEMEREFVGPALAIASLGRTRRRSPPTPPSLL